MDKTWINNITIKTNQNQQTTVCRCEVGHKQNTYTTLARCSTSSIFLDTGSCPCYHILLKVQTNLKRTQQLLPCLQDRSQKHCSSTKTSTKG
eukprot:CAMPEP_0113395184 /NCGR_PEP_ID=MMETSP0013_2-20120614/13014_1 /TAXON_ID=2843 ORGANISM="Skeletonema costatum, Strain 1716" /NCGR_SAMPLE_ID=MMETSP0013_2 /ASSEMBLY_ACC=CAM_ASM_000158 /LENGTH=91 /DNA_ID=CAMNT_0000279289 /DNA_START=483 /DNA_END=758 /DNA_ORIENTATION=- /assembly_acc=CAM_ASM_000158